MIFFCHQELYQAIDSPNAPPKLITMNIYLYHVCDNLEIIFLCKALTRQNFC